jgi:hypothetical protein
LRIECNSTVEFHVLQVLVLKGRVKRVGGTE